MKKAITMGDSAKDSITGFTGFITGISNYLTGCTQYLLQPECDGNLDKYPEACWFDEGRVEFNPNREKINQEAILVDENGCDYTAPIK